MPQHNIPTARWLVAVAGLCAFAAHAGSFAEQQADRVEHRQDHQAERIDRGVASGALTRREQTHMEARQERIDRLEGRVQADGKVTGREALRVERAQDKASRRIALNKHDRQQRPLAER